jgi:hypothetical protein
MNNNNALEIQYPLYNYINNNSPVNKRNSEFLVENIKKSMKIIRMLNYQI